MPTANVANPWRWSTLEMKPLVRGIRPWYPGKPEALSAMLPSALVWEFRPVSRHDLVGEHSAVVWKLR